MPKHPPSIDPAAIISPTAMVDEFHPSLTHHIPPTVIEAGASIGHLTIVYASARVLANASIGDRCTLQPHSVVKTGASLGDDCRVEEGAVVGEDAVMGPGCHVGPDCGVGTGAELGPGVMLLDRTRLPGKQSPAMVGAGAKVGGGAIVAGVKVGANAVVAAGEVVEDDVPDGAVWMGGRVAGQF
jgi:UDP-3-O-[3-hydroxymyristoyl] glucosamine N-acyltransferase